MAMKMLVESVQKLVSEELERASQQHGAVHASMAEAYAVMLEEFEETKERVEEAENILNGDFWSTVRTDDPTLAKQHTQAIFNRSVLAACESIQLAAMAAKTLRTIDRLKCQRAKESIEKSVSEIEKEDWPDCIKELRIKHEVDFILSIFGLTTEELK